MMREEVLPRVEWLVEELRPACERIEIAGSIRRQKQIVKDCELVIIPKPAEMLDLLGGVYGMEPLALLLEHMVQNDLLQWDTEKKCNGPKQKRLLMPVDPTLKDKRALVVELYMATRENWGNIFAIRTGSADFGKWCMTARMHRGGMPNGLRQSEGCLWNLQTEPKTIIPCYEEADWFAALGLPVLPPHKRDEAGIFKLKGHLGL